MHTISVKSNKSLICLSEFIVSSTILVTLIVPEGS